MWRLAFWWRGWRYRRQARHLPLWESVSEPPPEQDFYGSMTLAGEYGWLPAPEVAHSGWWGQTAAELAPEALEPWRGPRLHYATGVCWCGECHDEPGPADSGLGAGSSLAPGPDPGQAVVLQAHSEPDPPTFELGPNAARVLARYERRRRERWRLDWDNEAVAA